MKKNLSVCMVGLTIVAALTSPLPTSAQQPRYKLIDMGTLGGPQSYLNDGNSGNNAVLVLNNSETLAGWADTSAPDPFCFNEDCYVSHAFQWHAGVKTDLGSLADGLSSESNWVSMNGLIVGVSLNGEIDPLLPGFSEIRGVLWRNRRITDLGTLPEGGYESWANAVNSNGQVVGWATNTIPDLNSMAAPGFLPTRTRAFFWQKGTMQDLGTLGTGTDAMAQFINERGQVVGWSYTGESQSGTCNPGLFPLPTHSFIWDEEKGMRDLGTLGGTCVQATAVNDQGVIVGDNVNDQRLQRAFLWRDGVIQDLGGTIGGEQTGAEGINQPGQVIGFATIVGEILYHATLWKRIGQISDLGVLGQDLCSFASSINSNAQIVGASQAGTPDNGCTFDSSTRAFLWEDGSILDLNTLVPPGASLHLQWAQDINDRGEIAGSGLDAGGNVHAFLLIPCAPDSTSNCQEDIVGATETTESQPVPPTQRPQGANPGTSIRQMLRRQPSVLHRFPGPIGAVVKPHTDPGPATPLAATSGQANPQTLTPISNSRPEAPMADMKCPGGAVAEDNNADQVVDSSSLFLRGRCIEDSGKLTGSCVTRVGVGPSGCFVSSGGCQRGATAKNPGVLGCCGLIGCARFTVDLATGCSP